MDPWLNAVYARLAAAGFTVLPGVGGDAGPFTLVARRSRFELTKFGFSETFFTSHYFDHLTTDWLRAFSADAFDMALRNRAISLPRGLFESVWSYAVAIARTVDEPTAMLVRSTAPPKHWASAEIPVIYDATQGRLSYFEKTPLWGAAYYAGFRRQIQNLLGGVGHM